MEENKTNQEAKEEELKNALSILDTNLRFYNQGRKVPADALKKIQAGRLKGMSDINQ